MAAHGTAQRYYETAIFLNIFQEIEQNLWFLRVRVKKLVKSNRQRRSYELEFWSFSHHPRDFKNSKNIEKMLKIWRKKCGAQWTRTHDRRVRPGDVNSRLFFALYRTGPRHERGPGRVSAEKSKKIIKNWNFLKILWSDKCLVLDITWMDFRLVI